ncbi:hypothetical protein HMPREF3188_00308 [Tissierellia bacterium KA00581]|nr:hypothetical protein HMPREF3188_00308 [Tissierellia bacterium KA00581]
MIFFFTNIIIFSFYYTMFSLTCAIYRLETFSPYLSNTCFLISP